MTILPIVERELRVLARRPGTYWGRLSSAAVVMAVTAFMFFGISHHTSPQQLGMILFQATTWLIFLQCYFGGAHLTADCISSERRDGTLGLLFLTDLRGRDVVFGKLASSSLSALYGLVAVLPVMMIPVLLGGVSWAQVARVGLAVMNGMFFSLCVGMFFSSWMRQARHSTGLSVLILMLLGVGLPLLTMGIMAWLRERRGVDIRREWFIMAWLPSPGLPCVLGVAQVRGFGAIPLKLYWMALALHHVLGWVLLAAASYIVPRRWQDKAETARGERRRSLWRRWMEGGPEARVARRRQLMEINPFLWLNLRERAWLLGPWLPLLSIGVFWAVGLYLGGRNWLNEGVLVLTTAGLLASLKFSLASACGQRFVDELQAGTLELILSTPFTVKKMLHGQWLSAWRKLVWPALLAIVASAVLMFSLLKGGWNMPMEIRGRFVGAYCAGMLVLVADLLTIPWVAVSRAMTSKQPRSAIMQANMAVMMAPWMFFGAVMAMLGMLEFFFRLKVQPGFAGAVFIWLGISLGWDAVLWWSARQQVLKDFRTLAMRRYSQEEANPMWARFGKFFGRLMKGRI